MEWTAQVGERYQSKPAGRFVTPASYQSSRGMRVLGWPTKLQRIKIRPDTNGSPVTMDPIQGFTIGCFARLPEAVTGTIDEDLKILR